MRRIRSGRAKAEGEVTREEFDAIEKRCLDDMDDDVDWKVLWAAIEQGNRDRQDLFLATTRANTAEARAEKAEASVATLKESLARYVDNFFEAEDRAKKLECVVVAVQEWLYPRTKRYAKARSLDAVLRRYGAAIQRAKDGA